MEVFELKRGDTRPVLRVPLQNPDGSPHDLTDSTAWLLIIRLSDGSTLTRIMAISGPPSAGILEYAWVSSDCDPVSGGGTVGGLVPGPTLPLQPGQAEHRMEYQVDGPGGARMTFPNGGDRVEDAYDILRVWADLA